jgi:hypothetical protein
MVVRLNPVMKTVASAGPAPERPRACLPEVDHGACLEFAESRRTGNIEITLKSFAAREASAENGSGVRSPVLKAAPSALDARPSPHAGMPAATGDFCEDLRIVHAEAPPEGMIEELMAQGTVEPASETPRSGSTTRVFRGGMDVRLARIIDAWPRLSARTRAAMSATLENVELAEDPAVAASLESHRPLAVRPIGRAAGPAKNAGAAGRRRKGRDQGTGEGG